MSPSSVLLDQELLQRHRLRSGWMLPARQRFLHGGSAHGQPVLEGEASVQTDQAGLPAGGRGVLRWRHLEHLVRPRPHRGRPRHGQGTGGDCRSTGGDFRCLHPLGVSACRSTASWSTGWSMCPAPSSGSLTWPSTCRGTSTTRLAPTRRTTCQCGTNVSVVKKKSIFYFYTEKKKNKPIPTIYYF